MDNIYDWKYTNIKISNSQFQKLPKVAVWSPDRKRTLIVKLLKIGRKYIYLAFYPNVIIKQDKNALIGIINPRQENYLSDEEKVEQLETMLSLERAIERRIGEDTLDWFIDELDKLKPDITNEEYIAYLSWALRKIMEAGPSILPLQIIVTYLYEEKQKK